MAICGRIYLLTSVSLSIFIYYKFLKKIPEENKKKIEELLNSRLSYETTNHNSVLNALNPNTAHLSKEHSEIFSSVSKIKDSMIRHDKRQKLNHESLGSDQKIVVDSINIFLSFRRFFRMLISKTWSWQLKTIN